MALTQGRTVRYHPGIYVLLPPGSCTRARALSSRCYCVVSVGHSVIPRTIGYVVRLLLREWGWPSASLDRDHGVESASQRSLATLAAFRKRVGRGAGEGVTLLRQVRTLALI